MWWCQPLPDVVSFSEGKRASQESPGSFQSWNKGICWPRSTVSKGIVGSCDSHRTKTRVTLLSKKLTVNLKKLPREDMICGNACVCIRRCDLWKRWVVNKTSSVIMLWARHVCTYVVGGRVGMNDTCYFTFDLKKLDPTPPHDLRSIHHVCKCKERHHTHPTPHPTHPHDLRSIDHVCKCKERHHPHPTPPPPPPKKSKKWKKCIPHHGGFVDRAPTTLSAWVLPLWIVKWTSWWEVKAYTVIYTLKKHSYDSLPFASPWWSQFRSQMYGGRNLPYTVSEGVYWLCWYSYTIDMEKIWICDKCT